MKPPHIVLDISRLMWRTRRATPTGIDRVELAYARYLLANVPDRLSFVGWWGRLSLLPRKEAIAMVESLHAIWTGATANGAAYGTARRAARKLCAHALLHGEAPLHAYIVKIDAPIVYFHVSHYRLHRPAALERFKRRVGAQFVFFVHDLIPIEHPEHVPPGHPRKHRQRIDSVSHLADCIIVNSEGTRTSLQRLLPAGVDIPTIVAPLGLGLNLFQNVSVESRDQNYFVCLGTIESRKNHLLLLQTWREISHVLGSAAPRLIIVGRPGWKSRQVTKMIRQLGPVRELVEIKSLLSDADVTRLLAGACALLHPSFAEGFGLPIAESLALGVPVLCSDLAELRELGGDVPEYLDPYDDAAWCGAVQGYSDPNSAMRSAQLARMKKWRRPSWDEHFAVIRPLIDGADPTSAFLLSQKKEVGDVP